MRTLFTTLSVLLLACFCFQACNPNCESISASNIAIDNSVLLKDQENQIFLRSVPTNFLLGRSVYIDEAGTFNKKKVESIFTNELGGLIATIPKLNESKPAVYVEDPDCRGDFLYVNALQIEGKDFFLNSNIYIIPPLPFIHIPVPQTPSLDLNITNAWVTPNERNYCIWFVPEERCYIEEGGQKIEIECEAQQDNPAIKKETLKTLREGTADMQGVRGPIAGSRELYIACADDRDRNPNAEWNPVRGTVDKENNTIFITIDRRHRGLGEEHLKGFFITKEQLPASYVEQYLGNGGICNGEKDLKHFMYLRSEETGRQLIVAREDDQ